MMQTVPCALIGKWRITEADTWDRDYLDMLDPAQIIFEAGGHGTLNFGCVKASLDCEHAGTLIHFNWQGFDEMDEVSGDGSAELLNDGHVEIELRFRHGDEAIMKARRW